MCVRACVCAHKSESKCASMDVGTQYTDMVPGVPLQIELCMYSLSSYGVYSRSSYGVYSRSSYGVYSLSSYASYRGGHQQQACEIIGPFYATLNRDLQRGGDRQPIQQASGLTRLCYTNTFCEQHTHTYTHTHTYGIQMGEVHTQPHILSRTNQSLKVNRINHTYTCTLPNTSTHTQHLRGGSPHTASHTKARCHHSHQWLRRQTVQF